MSEPAVPLPAAAGEATGDSLGSGTSITPYRDGPLIVRGSFSILDQDGSPIDPGRETVALCRCGKSGIKPFCDGAHRKAGFRAGTGPSRPRPVAALRRAEIGEAESGPEADADG